MNRLHNLQRNLAPVDPVEQADPLAEENRRQRDGELIDQARVEILEDGVGTAGDPDIPAPGDLTRLPQRALDSVIEVDYRHIKTTMDMDEFTAQTPDMFRKELAAGLLTYNLICATLVQAAQRAQLALNRLSFQRGLRRVRDALLTGVPAWVLHTDQLATYLLSRLAQCRLAHQPLKIAHEPRKVRRRPQVFPALKGDRNAARQQVLQQLGAVAHPTPANQDAAVSDRNEAQQKAA